MSIQLGLCCHNLNLRYGKPKIFTGRTIKLSTIYKEGLQKLIQVSNENLDDLKKMIEWNYRHGIFVYRISSDIIPHSSNFIIADRFGKSGEEYMQILPFITKLREIGNLAKKYNMRLTFHPGQYVQIATPNEDVYKKSIQDLLMHATILDFMGMGKDSVMVIHGGGTYKDKNSTIKVLNSRLKTLPEIIKKRIVLENDERQYSITDLLPICQENNIPLVFDYHHYECHAKINPDKNEDIYAMTPAIIETWKRRGIKPKFHLSEQGDGRIGCHSTIIKDIPKYFFDLIDKYKLNFDLMIEAKGKEVSLALLYSKYPKLLKIKGKASIPAIIPKQALKDVKIDQHIKDSCICAK